MSGMVLEELLKSMKSDRLEFSTFLNKETICRTMCAFLNSAGGTLLLGVQEGGIISGVANADESWVELSSYMLAHIAPQPFIEGGVLKHGDHSLIYIRVAAGKSKPYLYKENCYIRSYSETLIANYQQLMKMLNASVADREEWESKICVGADYRSLNTDRVESTIRSVNNFIQAPAFKEQEGEAFLTAFGLIRNGFCTHAATLLFGYEVTRFIPQCRIRITHFFGLDSRSKALTTVVIVGNLFDLYEKSQQQVTRMLRNRESFSLRAIKEGLKNAILHNFYASSHAEIVILLFKDRIEIQNSVKQLPTPTNKEQPSGKEPNPTLSHFFFLCGLTSKLGLGCAIIAQESKTVLSKKPKWEAEDERFTCTIYGTATNESDKKGKNGQNKFFAGMLDETIENIIFEGIDRHIIDKISNSVMEAMVELLKHLHRRPGQNAEALSKRIGRPKPTIERYLQLFKKLNCIYFEGSPKSGGYCIREEVREILMQVENYK